MGQMIHCDSAARDTGLHNLFQITDWVTHILLGADLRVTT